MSNIEKVGKSTFERIKQINKHGQEYWSSRELGKILGYSDYRNFLFVTEKAKEACKNSGQKIPDHFIDTTDMVQISSGTDRGLDSIHLSRYACYLIVQNADPSKEIVALGQTYFALQTRKQEIIESKKYQELKTEDEKRLFLRNEY